MIARRPRPLLETNFDRKHVLIDGVLHVVHSTGDHKPPRYIDLYCSPASSSTGGSIVQSTYAVRTSWWLDDNDASESKEGGHTFKKVRKDNVARISENEEFDDSFIQTAIAWLEAIGISFAPSHDRNPKCLADYEGSSPDKKFEMVHKALTKDLGFTEWNNEDIPKAQIRSRRYRLDIEGVEYQAVVWVDSSGTKVELLAWTDRKAARSKGNFWPRPFVSESGDDDPRISELVTSLTSIGFVEDPAAEDRVRHHYPAYGQTSVASQRSFRKKGASVATFVGICRDLGLEHGPASGERIEGNAVFHLATAGGFVNVVAKYDSDRGETTVVMRKTEKKVGDRDTADIASRPRDSEEIIRESMRKTDVGQMKLLLDALQRVDDEEPSPHIPSDINKTKSKVHNLWRDEILDAIDAVMAKIKTRIPDILTKNITMAGVWSMNQSIKGVLNKSYSKEDFIRRLETGLFANNPVSILYRDMLYAELGILDQVVDKKAVTEADHDGPDDLGELLEILVDHGYEVQDIGKNKHRVTASPPKTAASITNFIGGMCLQVTPSDATEATYRLGDGTEISVVPIDEYEVVITDRRSLHERRTGKRQVGPRPRR